MTIRRLCSLGGVTLNSILTEKRQSCGDLLQERPENLDSISPSIRWWDVTSPKALILTLIHSHTKAFMVRTKN